MINQLNKIMEQAYEAFLSYQQVSGKEKKEFLYAIAEEIEALGDELLQTASVESNLPVARGTWSDMWPIARFWRFGSRRYVGGSGH